MEGPWRSSATAGGRCARAGASLESDASRLEQEGLGRYERLLRRARASIECEGLGPLLSAKGSGLS